MEVVERVRNRISGWQAEKSILIQFVSQSLVIHPMHRFLMAISNCRKIDNLNGDFFCGFKKNNGKIFLSQSMGHHL